MFASAAVTLSCSPISRLISATQAGNRGALRSGCRSKCAVITDAVGGKRVTRSAVGTPCLTAFSATRPPSFKGGRWCTWAKEALVTG